MTRRGERAAVGVGGDRRWQFEAIRVMRSEGWRSEGACRVLGVSESGFCARVEPAAIGYGRSATGG